MIDDYSPHVEYYIGLGYLNGSNLIPVMYLQECGRKVETPKLSNPLPDLQQHIAATFLPQTVDRLCQ